LRLSNRAFRRALLSRLALSPAHPTDGLPIVTAAPGPARTTEIVRRLGFVQVDAVSAVERAHHHVLFTRDPDFRHEHLARALEDDRSLFENWTHDAAILPVESFADWRHVFRRAARFEVHAGYRNYFAPVTDADLVQIKRLITRKGASRPRDVESRKVDDVDDTFGSPKVAKLAMEFLWRTGPFAVTRRDGQEKVYDLASRVIPSTTYRARTTAAAHVDRMCRAALLRLGAATPARIARFFDAVSTDRARRWCERHRSELVEVRVERADGTDSEPLLALADQVDALRAAPAAPPRLRLLNPFDPLIHDRTRTKRIFGFDYRIEIWVPPEKRKYGYYVLPILEGERFTGRIDVKIDRRARRLDVIRVFREAKIDGTKARLAALTRELERLARFVGADSVRFLRATDRRVR